VLKVWVAILNFFSALEFRIADKAGEPTAITFYAKPPIREGYEVTVQA